MGKDSENMLEIVKFNKENESFRKILEREQSSSDIVDKRVADILEGVKKDGDEALNRYMLQFDGVDLKDDSLLVSEEEFKEARQKMDSELAAAIKLACDNIIRYHERQLPSGYKVQYENGAVIERKYKALDSVAVTVPGDMAPLFSSLYMNVIPAKVAGVKEICIITKPQKDKSINEVILYVAEYLGVDKVYKISGAQGIAAVAYGTERVNKVDAIVGPGNNYTQMAKKQLYGKVKIDSLAGPSEIAIIADQNADPRYVAADMLSQAEHGTGYEASVVFCTSEEKAKEIKEWVCRLREDKGLTRVDMALENYGVIFVVNSIAEAIEAVNMMAPEHAEVMTENADEVAEMITNAGAIFVGEYTPEPVGDYFCGSNHVLPTCGTARFSSGLSVHDFIRGYSVVNYGKNALDENYRYIERLARREGLGAHALSAGIRSKKH